MSEHQIHKNIHKNQMRTLQILTSHNFVNSGLILKIQNVFKSES